MRSSLLRLAFALGVVGAVLASGASPVRAGSITFGTPTASSSFGRGIEFDQPYSGGGSFKEVDVIVQYEGVFGLSVDKVEKPGSTSFAYTVDTSSGEVQPNTKLTAYFEVAFSDGSVQDGPSVSITYEDDRFSWHTLSGKLVVIHWYQGSQSFAQQALKMGEDGVAKAADFLGYTETKPIDFFVYPDQQPFYDALGPGTRDNVGGQANTETRTLFALVAPNELSYAASVVPHELTHVVFDDVTSNPYHFPPHWLNEGIAVYLSQGYDSEDRNLVSQAVSSAALMPLTAIRGQFPTTQERFYLAYAESVSAVDYFVRTYGKAGMGKLIRAFASGASDDEAFTSAIGMGVGDFDKAWQKSLGQSALASFGPRPAPTGPLPPGWTSGGMTGTSAGGASETPAVTAWPAASPSASLSSGTASSSSSGPGLTRTVATVVGSLMGLVALLAVGRRELRLRTDS